MFFEIEKWDRHESGDLPRKTGKFNSRRF